MGERDFDALTRRLATGRRGLLRGLAGTLGAVVGGRWLGGAAAKRRRGKLGAQAGGGDQPPYCTPGGQFCDDSAECCTGLCCGHKCCYDGSSPHVACCTAKSGKESCTVLTTSESHCGKCGNKCPPGMHCDAGKCQGEPADPDEVCASDRDCVEGLTCCGRVCCGAPNQCCNGECAFPDGGDHRHCGACGNACAPSEICCFNHGDLGPDWECRRQEECCLKQTLDTGEPHVPCGSAPHGTCCPADGATCCGDTCIASGSGELCCDGRPTDPGDHQHCGGCDAACGPTEVCCSWTEPSGDQVHKCTGLEECCLARGAAEKKKLFPCGSGPDGTCCNLADEECADGHCRPAKGQGGAPSGSPKGARGKDKPARRQRKLGRRARGGAHR